MGKAEKVRRERTLDEGQIESENEITAWGGGGGVERRGKSEYRFPNRGLIFGWRFIVRASGYLAPFRQIFCLD